MFPKLDSVKGDLRPGFSLMQTVSQQPGVGSYAVRGWVLSGIQSWHFGFGVSRVESSGLGPMQIRVGSSPGFSPGTLVSASIE